MISSNVRHMVSAPVVAAIGAARLAIALALIIVPPILVSPCSAYEVIAPGQEPLLADMLGRGATLPGGCTFSAGQVESALVRGTFQCPGGAVVIELRRAGQAARATAVTDRFAILVASGSPPAGLIDALRSRIHEREADVSWASPGADAGAANASPFVSIDLDPRLLQVGWVILVVASPFLCWRAGQALGIGGPRVILAVTISLLLAIAANWNRADEPLHANGHAWREAREVLMPWGARSTGGEPLLHGRGGIALEWLLAGIEYRINGAANPLRISRFGAAAAAGSAAFLTTVLVGSSLAGLGAGAALALMPLAGMLAVSGSPLAIPEWILPWSLGLLLAAGVSGDRLLLAGAGLAGALGTLSHTAMLAWPAALAVAWLIVARRRVSVVALAAFLLIALAALAQFAGVFEMIANRNQGPAGGLLAEAWRGVRLRNLLIDPRWVSPALLPFVALWVVGSLRPRHVAMMLASVAALLVAAAPFFAVTQCSSDAVRYQSALLGLLVGLAVAGLWRLPFVAGLGTVGSVIIGAASVAALVLLPRDQPPTDPVTSEHRLVADAVRRMQPGTLVVLPKGRFDRGRVIPDFPDFLLPASSRVVFEDDASIEAHDGPRLAYLGVACISWTDNDGADLSDLRPECRALRSRSQPWAVLTLKSEDLPRTRDGTVWTFHHLATGVPFGFFALGNVATTDERR